MNQFECAYFVGIGGIGMSAIARFFNDLGWNVAGYDKTETPLTKMLVTEGIDVHFDDLKGEIPAGFRDNEKCLVVFTPAIPNDLGELVFFRENDFTLYKRAEVLGMITRNSKAIGVAGTHGKTTTSSMLAYILDQSKLKCNAFLGGISTNFNSNYISSKESEYTIIEADEFDRSFLQLMPFSSILTSTDADHLDIYGEPDDLLAGFQNYVDLIDSNGILIRHINANVQTENAVTYAIDKNADYIGSNLKFENGRFYFDMKTKDSTWKNIELGIAGIHNVENAIACIAMSIYLGISEPEIRQALASFQGVKRRFEYQINEASLVYIDDYAHHPTEIEALISSIRLLYPNKRITGIFQPHLYSRTRDFFSDFAEQLSRLDEVILLPIYPAREEPIEGITSDALLLAIQSANKLLLSPEGAIEHCSSRGSDVYLTIGAGDIDKIIDSIKNTLTT